MLLPQPLGGHRGLFDRLASGRVSRHDRDVNQRREEGGGDKRVERYWGDSEHGQDRQEAERHLSDHEPPGEQAPSPEGGWGACSHHP